MLERKPQNCLKGKAKIVKKSLNDNSLKASKATSSSQINAKRSKFRNKGNKASRNRREEDAKKVSSRNDNKQKNTDEQQMDISHQAQKNKGKVGEFEKSQQKNTEKRRGPDRVGKTKPDCFRYRIMGVSMGILFFGGLKLEPKAFGGAFPAQVRFNNKFKTELTVRQVRKLTALFQPAQVHSSSLPTRSPLRTNIRDREARGRAREALPHSERDALARDPYSNGDARSYPVLAHERDQHAAYRDVVSGQRRNLAPRPVSPAVEVHHRDYERDHLVRQPNLIYREAAPAHRETAPSDPLYLNEKEYPAYTVGARHALPSVTSATTVDLRAPDRSERSLYSAHAAAVDDRVKRSLYSAHAAAAVDDLVERSLYSALSSRYAFAGASYSYR
ncbi:hypothetical protein M0R45_028285 [Rubus argutus]|uniref:DCD domain-containing protein n=1 Tax=Rubus argutus TaxID=59490 RepID=A0AAW1W4N3_RUBAR